MELGQLQKKTVLLQLKLSVLQKKKDKRHKTVPQRKDCLQCKPKCERLSREDVASLTVALESIMLTTIVDAKEVCNVMNANIPNAFIQAQMPIEEGKL